MKGALLYSQVLFLMFAFSEVSASEYMMEEADAAWKAGVAKANITPEKYIWMGGYAFRNHPAEGKITDLWAKALALEDANGQKAVIVTMDLVGISKALSDRIRRQLGAKLHLSNPQIILNTSHTHTGPVVGDLSADIYNLDAAERKKVDEYADNLQAKIVNLVVEAFSRMKAVRLYSGNGITRFQVNRHTNVESTLKGTTHLNGPNDYAVPVIKVVDGNNKMMAVLFGYACHNTTLSVYQWSGDYAGFAQIELEKDFPGAVALFFQGAGGDQNPLPRGTVSRAVQYGKALAAAVEAVIVGEMKPLDSRLAVTYSEINLPFANRPPTKEELVRIINDSSARAYPAYHKRSAKRFLNTLEKGESLMSSYPWYPVQVWNVGGQAIFAFGGELTVGYTVNLKRIFGEDIFVLGYSNDIMSYIPTAKMLTEGGYEAGMSPVFTTPYAGTVENIIIGQAIKEAGKAGISPTLSRNR
ncbi:MAG: neutral/alkaline non-lysosomal ceramidase N-terminal domain-containing protein [Chitinophagaceae bacterium]|nr:neutral/alkaline non-lysosomal ceramidase N-terminal domain-containing protein [Chitinophagaceae bacterium]